MSWPRFLFNMKTKISPVDFLEPLRRINLNLWVILLQSNSSYVPYQTDTYIYKAAKVVAKYLGPLAKNDQAIRNTLSFPDLLKSVPSDDNYEDVSYDAESLFTSIPVQETIDYIL